ncbi:MAG TPA: FAD-binding and (Fe-S)-binding domain-containing protein [Chthoniobacterales bacterium]|nr:FAD-binding and (Fe-S)-binding domain-containing protein [Chthoniobacterales bacterium]
MDASTRSLTQNGLAPSSHAVRIDSFPEADSLARELRTTIKGEVRFNHGSRAAYSMDASNYRQIPIGIVVPRDEADVITTVSICRKFGAPILSRGGGTSLAGQGCNVAVVLDFSKYLNRILELDPEQRFARVQPGLVLDTLRDAAEKYGLTFAPDPSTHNRCTLGGMIGNNSSGTHSLMGGKVQDNIEELRVLLYDGTILTVGATSSEELARVIRENGRRGQIYSGLLRLRDRYGAFARDRFAKIPRRVSGYNFDELLPETSFNVARALVGSEGTCVIVLDAKVRLVHSPPYKSLVCLGCKDVFVAADSVPDILRFKPIALEGFEGDVLAVMRQKNLQPENIALLPPGNGYLLAEFGGDTAAEADAEADKLVNWLRKQPEPPVIKVVRDPDEVKRIWKVREASNGGTTVIPGQHSITHEGWEDAAVHPRMLGRYLRDYKALLAKHGYKGWYYGHFGEGCVHQRVNFDLETDRGVRTFRRFLEEAADLVVQYGGSISGEHGDGHARAFLYEKMFGPELVDGFRQFKQLWDPDNKLNPGKVVDPYPPEAFLKLGADYNPLPVKTHFHFPDDQGSLEKATQRCVGVGACRKTDAGTMCPSYQVTRDEIHSTRGRAHLLFEMLQGEVLKGGWRDQAVKESMDLCLSCKGCKSECPTNVDIATYKSEFLSHYYEGRPRPFNHYAFGFIDRWARLASFAPKLVNAINSSPVVSRVAKAMLQVAQQREIPKLAEEIFVSWVRKQPAGSGPGREVVLFADTFNNYFRPSTARAAWEVLQRAGFAVHVPQTQEHLCCGRPLYDFGLLSAAKKYLQKVLHALEPYVNAGLPVIMLEPSCASVFRDELRGLFPHHGVAYRLRQQTFTLSSFLQTQNDYEPPRIPGRKVLLHGHCHHKAVLKFSDEEALLRRMGVELKSLDSGCCGMAGPFGFESANTAISQALGERVLLPAVRACGPETIVLTDGFSCHEQIAQNTNREPLHIAEVLRMAMDDHEQQIANNR